MSWARLLVQTVLVGLIAGVVAVSYTRFLTPARQADGIIFACGFAIGASLPLILTFGSLGHRDGGE